MTVTLRPITEENFRAVIELEVRAEQSTFVAPNVRGLAETHVHPHAQPRAVYSGDDLVGFVLFHPAGDEPAVHCIVRLMIDQRFQGRGLGRRALEAAVGWIGREHGADRVRLSVDPENEQARAALPVRGFRGDRRSGRRRDRDGARSPAVHGSAAGVASTTPDHSVGSLTTMKLPASSGSTWAAPGRSGGRSGPASVQDLAMT